MTFICFKLLYRPNEHVYDIDSAFIISFIKYLLMVGADSGGGVLGGEGPPPPPLLFGDPQLHEEGKDVACMRPNAKPFSSYLDSLLFRNAVSAPD